MRYEPASTNPASCGMQSVTRVLLMTSFLWISGGPSRSGAGSLAVAEPIEPVLVHHFDEPGKLTVAPAGTKVTASDRIKTIPGWQGGKAILLPASGDTVTIRIPGGLDPRRGTLAFWFKVFDHSKWQLETTPLITLKDTDGNTVHRIRRTEATVHYGKNGALAYTQTGDAFRLLSDEWRHAALVWDAEGSDAPRPRGAVTYYVDGNVQGLFYIDLADKPLTQVVLGGARCNSAVDRLVVFGRALNREAILETKVVDETLGARVATAMRDWGPQRIALERRERRIREIVRRPDAVVIEAESPLLGRTDPGVFQPLKPWGRPRDVFVKYAYAKDEHGQMAMKVKMAIPREYQSQANVSSGNACRAMVTTDPLTWSFTVPKTGEYAILLRYSYPREFAVFEPLRTLYYEWGVTIDGKSPFPGADRFKLPQTGNGYDPLGGDMYPFKYWAVGNGRKVHLKQGRHTITVRNFSPPSLAHGTYTDDKTESLDCIVLTPADVTNPEHPEHLADYQRTPEMWVERRDVSESSGMKQYTYTVLMRSRSDAPATYRIRLDTGRLKSQRASMPTGGRQIALGPRAERKLTITFTTPAKYHGSERCLVRIWQIENRTRYDWWMWNSVPNPQRGQLSAGKTGHKPYRKRRGRWDGRSQASLRRAERIAAMPAQEIEALVPKWNHVRYPGDKPRLQGLLKELRSRHKIIQPDTLASIRGEIKKPRDLLGVRAMLASEVWEFHGGMKRAGVLRDGKPLSRHEAIAVKVSLDGGREDVVVVNFAGGTVEVPQAKIRTDATHLQVVYQGGRFVRSTAVGGSLLLVDGQEIRQAARVPREVATVKKGALG